LSQAYTRKVVLASRRCGKWHVPVVSVEAQTAALDSTFTDAEQRRLKVYRRAVAAGFFTDRS
jgi:hypothetical protein